MHCKAIVKVFGYLKRIEGLGIFYQKFPTVLEDFSNASWMTSATHNKSTLSWIFTLRGTTISWASKKQTCIPHSTIEAEFIALAVANKEAE